MATSSFKKEFKVTKRTANDFIKVFNKRPRNTEYGSSRFVHVRNHEILLKALHKQ